MLLASGLSACDEGIPTSCRQTGVCAADEICDRASGECVVRQDDGETVTDFGPDLAAASAPGGVVHVAALALDPAGLAAARLAPDEESLRMSLVVGGHGVGRGLDVAVGGDGQPRISFRDGGAVRLARFNGTNWVVETVDETATPSDIAGAWRTSVAVDEGGVDVVAYRDPLQRALKIAVRSVDGWHIDVADASESDATLGRGLDVSLAIAGGRPVVAHRDGDDGALRIVIPAETDWTAFEVGATARRGAAWGWYASASAAPAGNVAVAFQDASAGTLMVAINDRGELSVETADTGRREGDTGPDGIVGAFASLTYLRGRRPLVAYQDGGAGALMLAERDEEGRWSRRVLDPSAVSGHGVALVAPDEGGPVVVHRRLSLGSDGQRQGALFVIRP